MVHMLSRRVFLRVFVISTVLLLLVGPSTSQREENKKKNRNKNRERNRERKKNKNRGAGGDEDQPAAPLPVVTLPPVIGPPTPALSCNDRASCSSIVEKDFIESNCFCDDLCVIYDDCCEDFMQPATKPKIKISKKQIDCSIHHNIQLSVETYLVDKCPKNYNEDELIKTNCEVQIDGDTDEFLTVPVSGVESQILYKNYYCALCSGEAQDGVSFWHVRKACGGAPEGFNATVDGAQVIKQTLQEASSRCGAVEYFHPQFKARKCKSNFAKCPSNYNGPSRVKKRCKSHTAYMYAGLQVFKNKYCAQCMDVNGTYLSCIDNRTPEGEQGPGMGLGPPFSILLDINTGLGAVEDRVGVLGEEEVTRTVVEVRQCPVDHVYDPFRLTCRRIRCRDGTQYKDGRCEPIEGYDPSSTVATTTIIVEEEGGQENGGPPVIDIPDDVDDEDEEDGTLSPEFEFDPDKGYKFETPVPPEVPEDYVLPDMDDGDMPEFTGPNVGVDDVIGNGDDGNDDEPEPEPEDIQPEQTNEDGNRPEFFCPYLEFNQTDYFILANKSAYVKPLNKAIDPGEFIDSNGLLMVCLPEELERNYTHTYNVTEKVIMFKFDRYQDLVSFVGLLVSLTALLIHFVVYMMLPPLRNTPGKCIICLVVSLWFAQALFLAGGHLTEFPLTCFIVSAAMHYMFLAAFFWMNILAIDICRTFNSRHMGSQPRGTQCCRFTGYSLYAWLAPALVVAFSLCLDILVPRGDLPYDTFEPWRPYYGDSLCWITRRTGLLFLFAAPVGVVIGMNLIIYIITIYHLCKITRQTKTATSAANKEKDRNRFFLYMKLSFIMGLTWAFGFVAALTDLWYMWYVFIILNTLQGAFICFAFVCTRKVFRLLRERGKVHRTSDGRYYGNSSSSGRYGYTRQTYLYDGDAKIISQETSI